MTILSKECQHTYVNWYNLRKCWRGYKIAKNDGDEENMIYYAKGIQKYQVPSKVPLISFPMSIVMRELHIPIPIPAVPGPFAIADTAVLESAMSKTGFRNIHIERLTVAFEFATVEDYISYTKATAAPIKSILNKEPVKVSLSIPKE